MNSAVRTTCPYCGVGCGVLAEMSGDKVEVAGDPDHPANFGRLCSKGYALGETTGLEGRLLHPHSHGHRVSWDDALTQVAQGFSRIVREHGPHAVALYVSGQLLTEDYYVANKLMKGYIGTANIDTNSRLCMASAVAGHKRAFGEDVVPGCYEDLELADLIVLVGANTAWCHPVIFQRIVRAKETRPELKVVVIDPRRTATCDVADLHLPIRSGMDVWLFNGLLRFLVQQGKLDEEFVASSTAGVADALTAATVDPAEVGRMCGIDTERILAFYRLFADTQKVVTAFSQGVNQSSAGTDKVNSIINCHLLTGRLGHPGMGPLSLTGQPNAMGGREVGGLANTLAAHMDLANPQHRGIVQTFWDSPCVASEPGHQAVDLFDALHRGEVKAVWIMATNPVVSLPDADRVREALQRCELVVVSDCVASTDTTALAHVLLPAAAWGEKDGTVTNSERRISRQRAFLPAPGEVRPDWWIICQVAQRMGFTSGFVFDTPAEIFAEHAALSGADNSGSRCFDISGLAQLDAQQYDALQPVQWPVAQAGGAAAARLFADRRFSHADRKARFVPTIPRGPAHAATEEFPLTLNTGRIRDQWHTMTRTGRAARLGEHLPEPFVDIHAHDALLAGLREGELARVATSWGSMIARVRTSGEIARGSVFVPIHWSSVFASEARVGALVNPVTDPLSGEPEFKHTPVRVEPFVVDWYGFVLARRRLAQLDVAWWSVVQGEGFSRHELAGRNTPSSWSPWARRFLDAGAPDADYLEYDDDTAGVYRSAHVIGERLESCLYISRRPELPERAWLGSLFARERLEDSDRHALLAGRPLGVPSADSGPLVCSCFRVGKGTIRRAIASHGMTDAREVSAKLRAGSNCGSCIPEIRALLAAAAREAAAGSEAPAA